MSNMSVSRLTGDVYVILLPPLSVASSPECVSRTGLATLDSVLDRCAGRPR